MISEGKSSNIKSDGEPQIDGHEVWCDARCNKCGSTWVDNYELTGFMNLETE